jgi:hypothetical protein
MPIYYNSASLVKQFLLVLAQKATLPVKLELLWRIV